MFFFGNLSIPHRLTAIIMLACFIILLMTSGVAVLTEISLFRQGMVDKLSSLGKIVGANSRYALAFGKPGAAEEILSTLSSEFHIQKALIFDDAGKPFALYENPLNQSADALEKKCRNLPSALGKEEENYCLTSDHLAMYSPIFLNGQKIGTVYLLSDMEALRQRIGFFAIRMLLVFASAVLFVFILSKRLQHLVSRPILRLTETMKRISEDQNFGIRVEKSTNDEIGVLIESFNNMLAQVELRDRLLTRHRSHLEEQVSELTTDLSRANKELKKAVLEFENAKGMAEKANRTKSRFLANISHEIRTPMVGVLGMSELLLQTHLNEKQRSMTETICRSGESLLALLNDLLDLSKIEAGKLTLQETDFDIRRTAEDVLDLLGEKALGKGLDIACILQRDLVTTRSGDFVRLRQILLNLVGNAVKFTDEGEIVLRIWESEAAADSIVFFEVSDSGIGIVPSQQTAIFDSFTQGENLDARNSDGTGLGLAIVKQLIDLMGGEIGMESRPGVGTKFLFSLPLEKKEDLAPKTDTLVMQDARVLIADPGEATRCLLKEFFMPCGMHLQMAADWRSAAQQLESALKEDSPFDLALVDESFIFPEGAEKTAASLRPLLKNTRLIALGRRRGEKVRIGTPEDRIPIIYKPLRISVLETEVSDIFQTRAKPIQEFRVEKDTENQPDSGACILVAEDNAAARNFLISLLRNLGFRVRTVPDGRRAEDEAARGGFDLIFMDCRMPVVNGFEASRRIRNFNSRIPIVGLSAHLEKENIQACMDAGMNDFLSKPFKQKDMIAILDKWLDTDIGENKSILPCD